MDTKKCSACGLELPLSEFNKNRRNRDGLQSVCRKCFSDYNRRRYASDPDRHKSNAKRYREENPENVFDTRMRMCAKNPTKKNANEAVSLALRIGIMERPMFCAGCGCSDSEHRIEAHHHDYAKPLEVAWLCTPCHRLMDARRRMREGKPPYGKRKA